MSPAGAGLIHDARRVSVVEVLERWGGVAGAGTLIALTSRAELDRALTGGEVVRIARGRYALLQVDEAVRAAARLGGVLSLTSAALHHGWPVKHPPDLPHVTVSRGRKVSPLERSVHLHRAELGPDQIDGPATSRELTLENCLRHLPFDEALAVADSARREGVPVSVFERIADGARGPGSPQIRRVADAATSLAANPFESVLRAIAHDVPGLAVEPQVVIREPGLHVRPDLVDRRLRLVLEADSFEWHGGRAALRRDARRYNCLVVNGWVVLRFAWEDVMFDPGHVREVLLAAVALSEVLTKVRRRRRKVA